MGKQDHVLHCQCVWACYLKENDYTATYIQAINPMFSSPCILNYFLNALPVYWINFIVYLTNLAFFTLFFNCARQTNYEKLDKGKENYCSNNNIICACSPSSLAKKHRKTFVNTHNIMCLCDISSLFCVYGGSGQFDVLLDYMIKTVDTELAECMYFMFTLRSVI